MPGEFFGEEELIENSLRKFTVICIHPGSLYSINKKVYKTCKKFIKNYYQ